MQSGDLVTDVRGLAWVLDDPLGRGSWGTSWAVKGEDGTLGVLKVPHGRDELAAAPDADALVEACARTAASLREACERRRWPFLPRLIGTVDLGDGRTGLIFPRYPSSLEARIAAAASLSEVIALTVRVLRQLENAGTPSAIHGNLRPSNVLLDEAGDPVLADPVLPPLAPVFRRLEAAAPGRTSYLPPEARDRVEAGWDTWALCFALHRAAVLPGVAEAALARRTDLPVDGLDRVALTTLKDAVAARLGAERANKRFASRAVARFGAVLNRALSPGHDPSPPFRFREVAELRERLVEVEDLLHPAVETVSRLMLGNAARDGVFEGGEQVVFSVNVGTTAGVTAHDDIAVGVQLVDLDAAGDGRVRVEDARFTVNRYPSGKWRFEFVLPNVPPGRYRARVAFAVKDATSPPEVAQGEFQVRPRPGYVPPPADEDAPPPLVFREATAHRADDEADADDLDEDAPPAGTVVELASLRRGNVGVQPRPLRPDDDADAPTRPRAADPWAPAPEPWSPPPATVPPMPVPSLRAAEDAEPIPTPGPLGMPRVAQPVPTVRATVPAEPPRVAAVSASATTQPRIVAAPPRPAPPLASPAGQDWTAPRASSPGVRLDEAPLPPTAPGTDVAPSEVDDDLLLHDYPPPTGRGPLPGADLPLYDGSPSEPSPWDRVRDAVLARFQGDPFTAFFAVVGSGFVLFVVIAASFNACTP